MKNHVSDLGPLNRTFEHEIDKKRVNSGFRVCFSTIVLKKITIINDNNNNDKNKNNDNNNHDNNNNNNNNNIYFRQN